MRGLWIVMLLIGLGSMTVALLGPLGFGLVDYHVSAGATQQVRGGDVAALFLVGPVSLISAWRLRQGRAGGSALSLAPATYGLYMYSQLAITGDLHRYPGNSERFFPLFWALVTLCLTAILLAAPRLTRQVTPGPRPTLERFAGWYLIAVALFLTVGLHLPGLRDAWRDHPTNEEYLADPVVFWVVKLMDLGVVVPVIAAVGIGLLRGQRRARLMMAPVLGWSALLASSVAGMGLTMSATDSPGASTGLAAGFTLAALTALVLAAVSYRPLLEPGSLARNVSGH